MPLLRSPTPPRLPDPESDAPSSVRALLGTLRIYFNQLQASVTTLLGLRGGVYLSSAYGAYRLLTTQTAAAANTAYSVSLDTTLFESGVARTGSQVTITHTGIYHATADIQFANANANAQRVSIWMQINGVDAPNSRIDYSVPAQHGGTPGRLIGSLSRMAQLTANDTIEVKWSTESTDVQLQALPTAGSPTRPAGAAVCATLLFVSALAT